MKKVNCPIKKISPDDDFNYFFGYYDKNPWNKDESKILAHRVKFLHHFPNPEDYIEIGFIDLTNKEFTKIDITSAWNWQQGSQLQWISWNGKESIIYNLKKNAVVTANIYEIESKKRIELSSSIYTVSNSGKMAAALNYARLFDTRKDYGISGLVDKYENINAPKDDGIFIIDLETDIKKLVVPISYLSSKSSSDISQFKQWVNHVMFNPSGTRFCFLHRYFRSDGICQSRLFTSDLNGSDVRLLFEGLISHYDWKDDETILAWAGKRKLIGSGNSKKLNPLSILKSCLKPIYYALGKPRILMQKVMGDSYYLISDKENKDNNLRIGMGEMYCDGHCTYSRDKRWILTDGYTDSDNKLPLFLFDTVESSFFEIGRYKTPKDLDGELRIDLHPRFNKNSTEILIDSGMDGKRAMYIVNVKKITN